MVAEARQSSIILIGDAAEDDDALSLVFINDNCHRVVTDTAQLLGRRDVFDAEPRLLVKKEQVHIVQEWDVQVHAHLIVTTSCYE